MSHFVENGIIINCGECLIDIKRRIKEKKPFAIKKFRDTIEESRKEVLVFIISTLYDSDNCIDTPQLCRKKISQVLLEHGQFGQEEIDEIFNQHSHESASYTNEFISNHPEIDFFDLLLKEYTDPNDGDERIVETKYSFPFSDCDYKQFIGFCKMDIQILKCPDCGMDVTNTPDNVTWGHDLVCPVCLNNRKDEFDSKGIIRVGRPTHHGSWETQQPELFYTGTDYFAILHPICSKSPRKDKKGFMEVNGVWVDDCGRIVLSLECVFCGARNALKPFTKKGEVQLLNESGAVWKRVESQVLEMIEKGENDKAEFKSSLRWDYKEKKINKELEYEVARACTGFMNMNGGTLLIGVDDDKNILGIEKDYATLGKERQNEDGFELQLTEVINKYIGKEYRKFLKITFEKAHGKDICYIEIRKSSEPVFIKRDGKSEFVIRQGNRTQTLDSRETTMHVKMNWRN